MVGRPYARAWLWEAYRLDSLGTTGHAAFLELLAAGWNTQRGCSSKTIDRTAAIIEHGEAAMRRSDIDPLIQYYIGIAYQDRFSVARGDYFEGNSGAEAHTPETEEARVRAISTAADVVVVTQGASFAARRVADDNAVDARQDNSAALFLFPGLISSMQCPSLPVFLSSCLISGGARCCEQRFARPVMMPSVQGIWRMRLATV